MVSRGVDKLVIILIYFLILILIYFFDLKIVYYKWLEISQLIVACNYVESRCGLSIDYDQI